MSARAAIRRSRAGARSRYIAEQQAPHRIRLAAQRDSDGVRDDARRGNHNRLDRQIYRRWLTIWKTCGPLARTARQPYSRNRAKCSMNASIPSGMRSAGRARGFRPRSDCEVLQTTWWRDGATERRSLLL